MASLLPQDNLRSTLRRIDGRGYKAYKDLRGGYDFGRYALLIDHVQGDPFAAPSLLRLRLPQTIAKFPADLFRQHHYRVLGHTAFSVSHLVQKQWQMPDRGQHLFQSHFGSIP